MRLRWPTIARSVYWRFRATALTICPWEALAWEVPHGARIAVVGNAGYLRDTDFGRQIDACDLVIRMNNFQLGGYERSIGTRADLLLTNFSRYTMAFDNPDLKRARLVVSSRPMNFARHPRLGVQDRLGEHVTRGMLALGATRTFVPDFDYFADQVRQLGAYPTTGLMALRLVVDYLADRCGELFLTGFSFFQGRSHYFSEQSIDAARLHNLELERRAFQEAVRRHANWIHVDPIVHGYLGAK